MMKIVSNILITIILSTIGSIGAYKYAPMSWFETKQAPKFGTTITTINGSDTLSNSRTTINDNFTALNNGKIEVGTTSVNSITTLSNLATIGTITSGNWNGTAIPVGYGGTGTTSPTSNQVMIGNGSSGFKVIGFGTSGQFLTSGGNGSAPSWTTGSLDTTANFNWTGTNLFKTLVASTTVQFNNGGSGYSLIFPSAQGASGQGLINNGSGTLSWTSSQKQQYTYASTTASSVGANVTFTSSTLAIPASTLTASSSVRITGTYICVSGGATANNCTIDIVDNNGNVYATYNVSGTLSHTFTFNFDAIILSNNSTSAQTAVLQGSYVDTGGTLNIVPFYYGNTTSIDWSVARTFGVKLTTTSGASNTGTLNPFSIVVQP